MGDIHKIKWLVDGNPSDEIYLGAEIKKTSLPYPPEVGFGYTEHIDLLDGITILQTKHNFTGEDRPFEIEIGHFSVQFPYPMFLFHIIHSGLKKTKGNNPEVNLILSPGEVVFGRGKSYDLLETIYTEENVSTTACIIPESTLAHLLGTESTQLLFQSLRLPSEGSYGLTKIPQSITNKLENASPDHLEGSMRALFAQSTILQFLVELYLLTANTGVFLKELEQDIFNVEILHSELLQIKEKIPNLTELAKKYNMSPGKLNQLFFKKYNESIYSFLSNQRLEQAYQALFETEVPMKTLAHTIGYSHVNHFITAFKKKFGVTPGSIRK